MTHIILLSLFQDYASSSKKSPTLEEDLFKRIATAYAKSHGSELWCVGAEYLKEPPLTFSSCALHFARKKGCFSHGSQFVFAPVSFICSSKAQHVRGAGLREK